MSMVYSGHRKYTLYFSYSDEAILMIEYWIGNAYIVQLYINNYCNLVIWIQHVYEGFGAWGKYLGRI